MRYFQIIDKNGDDLCLFGCPDTIDEKIFQQALAGYNFDLEDFEDNNTIGAERIFTDLIVV